MKKGLLHRYGAVSACLVLPAVDCRRTSLCYSYYNNIIIHAVCQQKTEEFIACLLTFHKIRPRHSHFYRFEDFSLLGSEDRPENRSENGDKMLFAD
jgi:hypothetical protein